MRDDLIGTMGTRLDDDEMLRIYTASTGRRYGIAAVASTDRAGGRVMHRRADGSPVIVLEETTPGGWTHVVLGREDLDAEIARGLGVYAPGSPVEGLTALLVRGRDRLPDWPAED